MGKLKRKLKLKQNINKHDSQLEIKAGIKSLYFTIKS